MIAVQKDRELEALYLFIHLASQTQDNPPSQPLLPMFSCYLSGPPWSRPRLGSCCCSAVVSLSAQISFPIAPSPHKPRPLPLRDDPNKFFISVPWQLTTLSLTRHTDLFLYVFVSHFFNFIFLNYS